MRSIKCGLLLTLWRGRCVCVCLRAFVRVCVCRCACVWVCWSRTTTAAKAAGLIEVSFRMWTCRGGAQVTMFQLVVRMFPRGGVGTSVSHTWACRRDAIIALDATTNLTLIADCWVVCESDASRKNVLTLSRDALTSS